MKKFKFLILLACFLSCLIPSSTFGFSTHDTTISRSFNREKAVVGDEIKVTVTFTNKEPDEMRGFYYTEHIPVGLSVSQDSVKINRIEIPDYMIESGAVADVYSDCLPYRWILETPPFFEEKNPITPDGQIKIIYSVSASQAGIFYFEGFNWAGYYQIFSKEERAAYGYSEDSDKHTITFVKAPITAENDDYSVDEGGVLTQAAPGVLSNDRNGAGNLSPLSAVLNTDASNGVLDLNNNGSFTYTHDGSETAVDSFTYYATDGTDDSDTVTATININAVNDLPFANDDTAATPMKTPVTINILHNDSDEDGRIDPAEVKIVNRPDFGTAEINNDGTVTYTPNADVDESDSFTYTIEDDLGAVSNAATVVVNITNKDNDSKGGGCFISNSIPAILSE